MVVLAIAAMVSAVAMMSVRLPLAQSRHELAVQQLRSMDAMARGRSGSGRIHTLTIHPVDRSAELVQDPGGRVVQRVQFDRPMRVWVQSEQTASTGSPKMIVIDSFGTSPSYAVNWPSKAVQSDSGKGLARPQRWLLFLGLTGQVHESVNRRLVQTVMQADRVDAR